MYIPVNLLVSSNAYSHRKVAKHITEVIDAPFQIATHDFLPGYVMYPNVIYVGTMDYSSVSRFAMYDLIAGNSVYYATVEGIPVLTPKTVEYLRNKTVIANSRYTADMLERVGVVVDDIIPHGVKPVEPGKESVERAMSIKGDKRMVLWIGSNQRRKGLDLLYEVAKRLVGNSDIMFYVVTGPGETDLTPLQTLPNVKLNLNVNNIDEGELASLYKVADLVVSTSYTEGFGMTIAEAIAYGRPVLAPNYAPFTEYVDAKCLVNVDKKWWELYRGYMWFEMKKVNVDEFASKILELAGRDVVCGKWYNVTYYKSITRYLNMVV